MNLFNPRGQRIESTIEVNEQELRDLSQGRARNSIADIQGIFRDGGGRAQIRNQDLRQKTAEVQKEFE